MTSVIEAYKPDIPLSVHGGYSLLRSLTHMSCSLETLYEIPYIINKLAHKFTDGKVLMFGGGGYNIWQVVPRAWSHIFSIN